MIKGTLDGVLGNSFVEQRDPFKTNIWGEVDTGMMGEIPMWRNPRTGKMEPVDGYPGPVHGDIAGIFNPLNPFKWGEVPEIREQVQKGTYDPEEDVVSPTDQFLRGVSGRNKKLQEIMDQAGW